MGTPTPLWRARSGSTLHTRAVLDCPAVRVARFAGESEVIDLTGVGDDTHIWRPVETPEAQLESDRKNKIGAFARPSAAGSRKRSAASLSRSGMRPPKHTKNGFSVLSLL